MGRKAAAASPAPPQADRWSSATQEAISVIERESGGRVSLAVSDLHTGEKLLHHPDRKVKIASVIKLPILVHVAMSVAEGTRSWDEKLTLTAGEKVDGSGVLTQLQPGLELPLRDVCTLMTVLSDNTATNMVIEHVGVAPVNDRMRELGLPVTTLFRKSFSPDTPASKKYGLGVTTPREMLKLLTRIALDSLGDPGVCTDIMRMLDAQHYRDGIPRLLPADWKYAGKTGAIDPVRNDVGIVTAPDGRRFALSLFVDSLPAVLWTPDNPGLLALARLAKAILNP